MAHIASVAVTKLDLELSDGSKFSIDGNGIIEFDIQEKYEIASYQNYDMPHPKKFDTGRRSAIMTVKVEMFYNNATKQYEPAGRTTNKLIESRKQIEDKS